MGESVDRSLAAWAAWAMEQDAMVFAGPVSYCTILATLEFMASPQGEELFFAVNVARTKRQIQEAKEERRGNGERE